MTHKRFKSGVYSSVAAADAAMMVRRAVDSCTSDCCQAHVLLLALSKCLHLLHDMTMTHHHTCC